MEQQNYTKHTISVGYMTGGSLKHEKSIGHAFNIQEGNKSYFKLRLWQFGAEDYFVVKNRSNEKYTVFKKARTDEEGTTIFSCPVGFAFFDDGLKEYLQVQFNFPWQRCFLNIYPTNTTGSNEEVCA